MAATQNRVRALEMIVEIILAERAFTLADPSSWMQTQKSMVLAGLAGSVENPEELAEVHEVLLTAFERADSRLDEMIRSRRH